MKALQLFIVLLLTSILSGCTDEPPSGQVLLLIRAMDAEGQIIPGQITITLGSDEFHSEINQHPSLTTDGPSYTVVVGRGQQRIRRPRRRRGLGGQARHPPPLRRGGLLAASHGFR